MVAINSLTYLLYSFLTLAANDQPTDQNPIGTPPGNARIYPINPDKRSYSEQYDPDRQPHSEQYDPDRRPYSEQYDPDRRPYSEKIGRPVQPFSQRYLPTVDSKGGPYEPLAERYLPTVDSKDPVVSRYGDEYTTVSDEYTTVSDKEPRAPNDPCRPAQCQRDCADRGRSWYGVCVGQKMQHCTCRQWKAPVSDVESFETEDPFVPRYGDEYTTESDDYTTVSYEEPTIDPRCPPNKVYNKCENDEACVEECVCKPGFVPGRHGSCIKPRSSFSLFQ